MGVCPAITSSLEEQNFSSKPNQNMYILLIVLLVLLLVGALPGISGHNYGYAPSGGLGLVLLILLILLLLRVI